MRPSPRLETDRRESHAVDIEVLRLESGTIDYVSDVASRTSQCGAPPSRPGSTSLGSMQRSPTGVVRSCGELRVQFVDEVGGAVAEVAEGAVGAAAFGEGGVVEVLGADAGGGGDDVDHVVEPPAFCVA